MSQKGSLVTPAGWAWAFAARSYAQYGTDAAVVGALLLVYYLISYVTSTNPASAPASTYILFCILFGHLVNLHLWIVTFKSRHAGQTGLRGAVLIGLAFAALVFAGSVQAGYLYAWSLRTNVGARLADDDLLLSYQRMKELITFGHVACAVLLSARLSLRRGPERRFAMPSRYDLGLVLLCLLPLVNYHSRNSEYFTLATSVEYFALFSLAPAGLVVITSMLSGLTALSVHPAPVVAAMGWMYYSRPALSALMRQPIESSILPRFLVLLAVVLVVSFIHSRRRRWIPTFAILMLAVSSIQGYVLQSGGERAGQSDTDRRVGGVPPYLGGSFMRKPDIFFLVYDAYQEADLLRPYGIDNSEQMRFLEDRGFVVHDDVYSLATTSLDSIARTLDMRNEPRVSIGGNNAAHAVLRREGYRTHLVGSSYLAKDTAEIAFDEVFPDRRTRLDLAIVYAGMLAGEFKAEFVYSGFSRDEWLEQKRRVLAEDPAYPQFLYAHSEYPGHSQNSGRCLDDETARFADRLDIANQEMREDISVVLEAARDSIVIIAGDHGPQLTGDCFQLLSKKPSEVTAAELIDRYGMFLAIRWPDGIESDPGDIDILQDAFFSVFSALTGDRDVLTRRLERTTIGFGGIPPRGGIRDGVIQFGQDKGKRLFPDHTAR